MRTYLQVIILMLLGLQATRISGQAVTANLNEPVPLDESIIYGELDNGLTYYIKPLSDSSEKTNLRFYVKAGINHQDSDQLNMAHFVEHMAFKSTEHFPKGIHYELKTNTNLNMGQRDVGGSAGTHNSRYSFDAPANNTEALETGLLWFKDIATGLHLKNKEIDTERGVLIQELMLRTPDDIQEFYAKQKFLTLVSPCEESYIDFVEHHNTFDPERLKQFYKDWYRPELMAIVITGKIENTDALVKKIANHFSYTPTTENPRDVQNCTELFFNQPPRYIVVEKESDYELGDDKMDMELFFRDKTTLERLSSRDGVKRIKEIDLFIKIINSRLRETKVYGSFFDIHMLHTLKIRRTPSSFKAILSSDNNSEKKALQTFTRVLEQLKRYGVTKSEFSQAKKEILNQLEKVDHDKSRYWNDEIKDHLIYREALPSDKPGLIRSWLSNYEVSEFKGFIEGINFERPDIGIIAPTNHPALSYEENEIRSLISEVNQETIEPYVQPEAPINLMSSSEVKKLRELRYDDKGVGESGARELILANGVKVFLKSFKPSSGVNQNKIMLHGFNTRGALNFPAEDYFSAVNAPQFIKHSGVGEFDKFEMQRHFSTNSLSMNGNSLYINNLESGIKVSAGLADVEKMLQLIYLLFLEPRRDSIAFEDWRVQQARSYQNFSRVEQHDFRYNIKKFTRDNSGVSRGTERHRGLEETEMDRGFEIHKDLFGNAQNFTFIITGGFSMDSMLPLINKYLGNMPSFKSDTVYTQNKDAFVPKPIGPVFTRFKFSDSYTKTNYSYRPTYYIPVKDQNNWKEKLLVTALGRSLLAKVRTLRYEKGYGLYSLTAYGKYDRNIKQYEFLASFKCTPEEYPLLRQAFSAMVNELKSELISEEVLNGIVLEMQNKYENEANTPRYFHDKLYYYLRFDELWLEEIEFIPYLNSINPEDILNAAQRYLNDENFYEFVMMD